MRAIAELPLHSGRAPKWLFVRMKKLAGIIAEYIIDEYGTKVFLERLADPYWFQAFACVLGFDWHSSGTTTTTMAALKEACVERNLPIRVAGGKGKVALRTPEEIIAFGDELGVKSEKFVDVSRLTAKIDNSCVQDGYTLYHHTIVFDRRNWVVVQQGMREKLARRYHWFNAVDMFNDPHKGIAAQKLHDNVLNLVSSQHVELREDMIEVLRMPLHHDIRVSKQTLNKLTELREIAPSNFLELIKQRGVGAKTLRALALIAHLIYGSKIHWKDPACYSFAHGGKDGHPFPVDRRTYDESIRILQEALDACGYSKRIPKSWTKPKE